MRRSTTTTSTPANASSQASIIPVGPPPATTTACSVVGFADLLALLRLALVHQPELQLLACRGGVVGLDRGFVFDLPLGQLLRVALIGHLQSLTTRGVHA